MFEYSDIQNIQNLVKLFNTKPDNADSEDEDDNQPGTSGGVIPKKSSKKSTESNFEKDNPYRKIKQPEEKRREILDPENEEDYLYGENEPSTNSDWKKTPTWDITYKQQVTASDVFLHMGFKNPASASCEDMIITIHLPGDQRQNMDLKILKQKLQLVSPKFYLGLPLPQPVDPQKGNAKWDKDSEKLIVTLRMDRELDVVNF